MKKHEKFQMKTRKKISRSNSKNTTSKEKKNPPKTSVKKKNSTRNKVKTTTKEKVKTATKEKKTATKEKNIKKTATKESVTTFNSIFNDLSGIPTESDFKDFPYKETANSPLDIEIKNIKMQIGNHSLTSTYSSPYPIEYLSNTLYICEFCLKYMSQATFNRHLIKCLACSPPGIKIYSFDNLSVYEVDGRLNKVFFIYIDLLPKLVFAC
jgi:hypothetical protein